MSTTNVVTMAEALNQALRRSLSSDEKVLVLGEDIGKLGGVFRITDKLQDEFGPERVFDTPLAESAIVGVSLGLAMNGFRPVPEIQFDGFVYPSFNQIVSHVAKMRYRSRGRIDVPIVVRIPFAGGIGAAEHHSESPEAYFAHTAGLKVVIPATPLDAFDLLMQSISSPDPVIFLEPKSRYWSKQEGALGEDSLPIGEARVAKQGSDCTIVTYGAMVSRSLEVAAAAEEDGVGVEVIDLRSLVPFDLATVANSVAKTKRAVVVHEAPSNVGLGAEIAARITEECFYSLESPVLRVTGFDTPYPAARVEEEYLPDLDRVLDAVDRTFGW